MYWGNICIDNISWNINSYQMAYFQEKIHIMNIIATSYI